MRTVTKSSIHGTESLLSFEGGVEGLLIPSAENGLKFTETAKRISEPFGPDHFETQCGIKVRGGRIVNFFVKAARGELLGNAGDILRLDNVHKPVSVLLQFEGNKGTVIPAIPGFLAALTFDEGELVDVAYEPSANSWRWGPYQHTAQEIRTLRAIASASSQYGRFRLDQEDAINVAKKMQYAKGFDPTFSVYAAYAYHDLQAISQISEMSEYLRADIGATFFDLALLSGKLTKKWIQPEGNIIPFLPLLSQGWALLGALRVQLHPALQGIETEMRDSLWSLFNEVGVERLRVAMMTGGVR
jgi:hypothetical protein